MQISSAALLKLRIQAVQMVQQGQAAEKVAVELGVAPELVTKWARQAGLRLTHQLGSTS